jgi:hypothetical protein
MLRTSMRWAGLDRWPEGRCLDGLWRGQRRAAWPAIALILSGCASASTPTEVSGTATTSRFASLFGESASPAAPAAASGPAFNPDDCPGVEIRTGAGTFRLAGPLADSSGTETRYQLTFTQTARQCMVSGANVVMKVGVQGRIVVGPAGGPGQLDVPLRYAVVREGAPPRTIATKFKRAPAEVAPGQSNAVFSDVEEDLSFPMPSRAELATYMVYVGFDEIGDGPERKPAARKPAAKRK